jgi:hypothetical protein
MDAKKILLLILIVVAILTAMFIVVGVHRDKTDPPPEDYKQRKDGSFSGLDKGIAKHFRDTFALTRVKGCGWDGQQFQFNTPQCQAVIDTGKARSSSFELIPASGIVHACFGFEMDQLADCIGNADKRNQIKRGESKFTVSKDSAFLLLYCQPIGSAPCVVRLSREE